MPTRDPKGRPGTNRGKMMLIAHVGHWLVSAAYFVPVVGFLAWLVVTVVRDRRANRDGG